MRCKNSSIGHQSHWNGVQKNCNTYCNFAGSPADICKESRWHPNHLAYLKRWSCVTVFKYMVAAQCWQENGIHHSICSPLRETIPQKSGRTLQGKRHEEGQNMSCDDPRCSSTWRVMYTHPHISRRPKRCCLKYRTQNGWKVVQDIWETFKKRLLPHSTFDSTSIRGECSTNPSWPLNPKFGPNECPNEYKMSYNHCYIALKICS